MNANGLRTLDDDEPIATDSRSFAEKNDFHVIGTPVLPY